VVVFTLGLTESWWDKTTGAEFPMCPGTVVGDFDPLEHLFVNQDYDFVLQNLKEVIAMISATRAKGPSFLLTVSPVPLTATNSGDHVLVATMSSKSVLRAAAGQAARTIEAVSYFPSYEIINAPPYRATFFEPNMRSVNLNGVNHVMKTFFAGLQPQEAPLAGPPAPGLQEATTSFGEDLACEEELLSAFSGRP
jgi:hypothetical protein